MPNKSDKPRDISNVPRKTGKQWVDEGNIHFKEKRYKEAYEAYKQAAKRDPKMVAAQIGKGNALMELDYCEAALKAYERAIYLKPKSVEAHNGKGRALMMLDEDEEAMEEYQLVLQNYIDAWHGKHEMLASLGRWEEVGQVEEKVEQLMEEGYGDDDDEFPDLIVIWPGPSEFSEEQ